MGSALIPDVAAVMKRLEVAWASGRLVPFIGSGMSRDACTGWDGFVGALEAASGAPQTDAAVNPEALVQRANAAVRRLKGGPRDALAKGIRAALATPGAGLDIPPQTRALARLRWPLALTTNYDNCYAAAFMRTHADATLSVVGRGAEDCQRVLGSLSTAGRPLLWALQGHVADLPCGAVGAAVSAGLEQQLVVGHEEYRRVTYREPHFRRAFAEVFRQRSLLFVGAGLKESYLQELFGEVLETFGPGSRPHYAFIPRGEVDAGFLLARFQIVCVEYDEHGFVAQRLDELAAMARRPPRAAVAWSWGRVVDAPPRDDEPHRDGSDRWIGVPDFELVRGPLPDAAIDGDCLAVSAGGTGSGFFLSDGIWEPVQGWGVERHAQPELLGSPYLARYGATAVYAVRARNEFDQRSLVDVHRAARRLFDTVAPQHRRIHLQLLAAGGTEKIAGARPRDMRHFPERFSFAQIVRAWGAWRRDQPDVPCRLALYVMADNLLQDIAGGRIDVPELLTCADLRFFAEVVGSAGELERRLYQVAPEAPLGDIVDDLQLEPACWRVFVSPPPDPNTAAQALDETIRALSIEEIGVLPGSTIHFTRRDDSRR